ncbi:hypothetical protein Avbf_14711 [Armadillidium vulgare]|nr:hypothetical protein Avbf_14711 [Armadillidium vulgare]
MQDWSMLEGVILDSIVPSLDWIYLALLRKLDTLSGGKGGSSALSANGRDSFFDTSISSQWGTDKISQGLRATV